MVTSRVFLAPLVLVAAVSAQTFINYSGVPRHLDLLLGGGHSAAGSLSRRAAHGTSDPCHPSPCGRNTKCSVNSRGVGVCRCLPGYFPKPDTITGCGPQCVSDSECGSYRLICRNQKCINPCVEGNPCGINANCDVVNHQARCTCPPGYEGSPYSRCSPASITGRAIGPTRYHAAASSVGYRTRNAIGSPPAPPSDPCAAGVCGTNADCANVNGRAVCSCPAGYQGNPLTGCRRGECTQDVECPIHKACIDVKCQDPCSRGVCGSGADCTVENHGAICSCPTNYIGDPFVSCRYDPEAACTPSPCGENTNCKVQNGRAVCSCIQNYIGSPLSGCRPECVSNSECAGHQTCVQNRCRNACKNACGEGANCEAVNHRAVCSCPQYYRGSGLTGCYPECTSHSDCAGHQACFKLRCADPCDGACGVGAECTVTNHKAICKCPRGFEGHPFDRCTPARPKDLCSPNPCGLYAECNPGTDNTGEARPVCTCPRGYFGNALTACTRGECETSADCRSTQACYGYSCRNPCVSDAGGNVCGTNALCNAKNHKAVCYCPQQYTGDPLTECRLKPLARSNTRRYKRFLDGLLSLARREVAEDAVETAEEQ